MSPQTVCPRGCIITLVAFVWLFSTVFIKMVPQSACPNGCIVTLVAFVRLFSTFSNVLSNHLPEWMQSLIGCICLAFLYCVSSDGPSKNAPLNTCYHLFCNCNSLNHIYSEQRLRALIRCAFSEFVCTVFQTCIPDQNKWKVFLNAYEGCVLSMQYMMGNIRSCK